MDTNKNSSLEDLNKFFNILYKHIKLIIGTTIITVIVFAFALFAVIKPKYESTSEMIVNQKLEKNVEVAEQQQIQSADLQLVNTYKSILSSQSIGSAVKKSVGNQEYKQTKLSVNTDPTSQVISLDVTADSPALAAKVANKTASIFKRKVKKIMNVNNVSIISKARSSKTPVSPKKALTLFAGFFAGLILGMFLSLFKEYNAKTIDDVDYITDELGLTNLGTISDIDMKKIKKDIKH